MNWVASDRWAAFLRWCTVQYEHQEIRRLDRLFLAHCRARKERIAAITGMPIEQIRLHDRFEEFAVQQRAVEGARR